MQAQEIQLQYRRATREDVVAIVALLADDVLGKQREKLEEPLAGVYYQAFEEIDRAENQALIVVENADKEVVGTLQLSFLRYLTHQGSLRMQIEGVRIRAEDRGKGYGTLFFAWAIAQAKEKGVAVVQLMTDKQRPQAKAFYEQLGFQATHEGMKLVLK